MESKERLLVVSNRLPVTLHGSGENWKAEPSAGGLATAMKPILDQTGGLWIGWPGDSSGSNSARQRVLAKLAAGNRYCAVDLAPETAKLYYEGYANQTLWPLFHHFPSRITFAPEAWSAYVEANKRFRDVVVRNYRSSDLIWIHDYHLMLLPQMLRKALPDAKVGFFLHIPFPSSEVFRILPHRDELLHGLLGADLLGFQTHSHLQHFRTSLLRVSGMESRIDQVRTGSRYVRLEALPIGISPGAFEDLLESPDTADRLFELKQRFEGRRILLAVDRLDYTKGIPERLRAYRHLLDLAPQLRKRVVLIQVAVPSRDLIDCYAQLKHEVNDLVSEINGQYGTPDWTPLIYIRRGIPRTQLVALYATADVAWVTPLRDGLNLVAKEYVACKQGRDGALVLSEFAGAAAEMGEAFSVNPYDEERTALMVNRVLSLPAEERRQRMQALYERVHDNNVYAWSERFTSLLRGSAEAPTARQPGRLDGEAVVRAYATARRRLLLLDYDGTLVPYANRPEIATPSPELLSLVDRLTRDPANSVAIISGRRRDDLERWFGGLPALWLAAEHGAAVRRPDARRWEPLRAVGPAEWKSRVRPVFEHFVRRTPGSLIEEKEHSLVWHYRMADAEFGEWLANELLAMLDGMLSETELRPIRGHKTVEVKPVWVHKGEVAAQLLAAEPEDAFRFAVGDDRTDEDIFSRMGDMGWTVHVGEGHTRARYVLPDFASVRNLLTRFAEEGERAADRLRIAASSDLTDERSGAARG